MSNASLSKVILMLSIDDISSKHTPSPNICFYIDIRHISTIGTPVSGRDGHFFTSIRKMALHLLIRVFV